MKLSEKITAQRKAHGLSQEELADRLGVSRQAVSRWEQGSALPDANNLVQLSRTFGVTTDYLLHDDYENDQDLPPVRENQETHFRQIFAILVMLEVMVLIIQFLAVFVLQSVFFGILSFLPMVAVIGGFEYAWQKNPRPAPSVRRFRLRFYQVTAWLGFYFPVRLFMEKLAVYYPRPHLSIVFEAITLAVYLTAAFCVTLELEKRL